MGPGVRRATSPAPVGTASPASGSAMARRIVRMELMSSSVVSMGNFFTGMLSKFDFSCGEGDYCPSIETNFIAKSNSSANTENYSVYKYCKLFNQQSFPRTFRN